MMIIRLWRLLRMMRLLLAQPSLVPPDRRRLMPIYLRLLHRLFIIGTPRFNGDKRSTLLSDYIRHLGPTYIKLGQFLATRPDIIGTDVAADLRHLQDKLPPFDEKQAQHIVNDAIDDAHHHIAPIGTAIAAASIAQVHRTHHPDNPNEQRAVKVLRPDIEQVLAQELALLGRLARMSEFLIPSIRRLRPVKAIDTLRESVAGEIDLRMEAAALSENADNSRDDAGYRVPKVIWDATARNILTMEWIDGIAISDHEALRAHGHDCPALARRLIQLFLTHALRDGFFHADMHQGNILITDDGTLVAIDWGITGRLSPENRLFLAEILYGFITRDYQRVARVHFDAEFISHDYTVDDFAQALRAIGEPIHNHAAQDISMARLLTQLFEVTQQFDMPMQPQLLLLQKTMVTVEGIARSLDPTLNIWQAAEPIVGQWLKQQMSPQKRLQNALQALSQLPPALSQAQQLMTHFEHRLNTRQSSRRVMMWLIVAIAINAIISIIILSLYVRQA